MSGLEVAFVVLAGVYTAAIAWLYTGVVRGGKSAPTGSGVPSVSIIVSARDEAETIADCLAALKAQESGSPIEVVVVDDRSTDRTADIVRETSSLWPHLSLVPASAELRFRCPKKSALAQGIEASSGEILLFTDADCCPPPDWVRETVARFGEDVGMVAGYARAPILRKSLKQSLLALDNLAIGALSAGGIGMGAPLACTGRNLAYRRQVYDQVGGFSSIGHLVGGDDVYLTRLVSSKTNWKTVYNTSEKSIVECKPRVADAAATANQKLRHASKASHYRGPARLLGVAAYAFHALLLVGILQLIAAGLEVTGLVAAGAATSADLSHSVFDLAGPLVAAAVVMKMASDLALLWRFLPDRNERSLLAYLPLLEIVYIPYVLLFVPLGGFGWFRWKDGGRGERKPRPEGMRAAGV